MPNVNIVKFGSAFIELESPWKMSVGLKPDINRATCNYIEFAKLTVGNCRDCDECFEVKYSTEEVTWSFDVPFAVQADGAGDDLGNVKVWIIATFQVLLPATSYTIVCNGGGGVLSTNDVNCLQFSWAGEIDSLWPGITAGAEIAPVVEPDGATVALCSPPTIPPACYFVKAGPVIPVEAVMTNFTYNTAPGWEGGLTIEEWANGNPVNVAIQNVADGLNTNPPDSSGEGGLIALATGGSPVLGVLTAPIPLSRDGGTSDPDNNIEGAYQSSWCYADDDGNLIVGVAQSMGPGDPPWDFDPSHGINQWIVNRTNVVLPPPIITITRVPCNTSQGTESGSGSLPPGYNASGGSGSGSGGGGGGGPGTCPPCLTAGGGTLEIGDSTITTICFCAAAGEPGLSGSSGTFCDSNGACYSYEDTGTPAAESVCPGGGDYYVVTRTS